MSGSTGEAWYILVEATRGSQWSLFAGKPYVVELPPLATDASSGSGVDTMPIERTRFYRTTIPTGALAWRLWLKDSSGQDWNNQVSVSKARLPTSNNHDKQFVAQNLLTEDFVDPGSSENYFIRINGLAGTVFELDSRQHTVEDISYGATITSQSFSDGFRFKSYRVQVPVDQIAWESTVTPTSGDPSIAVRRDKVPNSHQNDAFSEITSDQVGDSVTLVPPVLSNGTFYVTVYADAASGWDLFNGPPEVTPIDYVSSTLNTIGSSRNGWRYFVVSDPQQQAGTLGWLLQLTDQSPGTRIAVRRNAAPGSWRSRNYPNPSENFVTNSYVDGDSSLTFLQRPAHEADVWYVGVYSPEDRLDAFTLGSGHIQPSILPVDGSTRTVTGHQPGAWQFYRLDVTETLGGNSLLGVEARIKDWSGRRPDLVIRRGQLPQSTGSSGGWEGLSWRDTDWGRATGWPIGVQAGTDSDTWSRYDSSADGSQRYEEFLLSMAMGQPLEGGTYYLGVYNNPSSSSDPMSYTLETKSIGAGMSYEVTPLAFSGGSATVSDAAPREVNYFSVEIPANQKSWKVELEMSRGDADLRIRKDFVPNSGGTHTGSTKSPLSPSHTRLTKVGNEYFILGPGSGMDYLEAGTYYLLVTSEGENPGSTNAYDIGTGSSSYTLTSVGAAPVTDLGAVQTSGVIRRTGEAQTAGEATVYQFSVPEGLLALEVRLENEVADMVLSLNEEDRIPSIYFNTGIATGYGVSGSGRDYWDSEIITVANPAPGEYTLLVYQNNSSPAADGSYDLVVNAVGATVLRDGSSDSVTGQLPGTWKFYRLDVTETLDGNPVLGVEARIKDWSGNRPDLVIRRGDLPQSTGNGSGWPQGGWPIATSWPIGNQAGTSFSSWSRYDGSADGSQRYEEFLLSMAMGQPLEAGTYYLGVYNSSSSTPMNYTLETKAVGAGMSYEVTPLAFSGGSATVSDAPPRQVHYFSVEIPANQKSWKVKLEMSRGDAELRIRKDFLPNSGASSTASTYSPLSPWHTRLTKVGNEYFILGPGPGMDYLEAGTYYLLVTSEGENPGSTNAYDIGTGSSSYTLTSVGAAPVTDLGSVPTSGEIRRKGEAQTAGEATVYQFSVPEGLLALELRLENEVADMVLSLNAEDQIPSIYLRTAHATGYGVSSSGRDYWDSEIITVANPAAGEYTLLVYQNNSSPAADGSYDLVVNAVGATVLRDGSSDSVTGQLPGTWKFYRLDVTETLDGNPVLGVEARIKDWSGNRPNLVIRRGVLPQSTGNGSGWPWGGWPRATSWPVGNQAGTTSHTWSRYDGSADGSQRWDEFLLSMAMGQPLEAGTYYLGVYNNLSSGSEPTDYTLETKAVGAGMSSEVTPLAFSGGSATVSDAVPREVHYFSVEIPENQKSWKVELEMSRGDAELRIRKDFVPNSGEIYIGSTNSPNLITSSGPGYTRLTKVGNEYFVLGPGQGMDYLEAGTYYLMVTSEGENPGTGNARDIGTGSSSYTLTSVGAAPVTDLGVVPTSGEIRRTGEAQTAGEATVYQFTVPEGLLALDVRLENEVSDMVLSLNAEDRIPSIYFHPQTATGYGVSASGRDYWDSEIITVANPAAGEYTLLVYQNDSSPATDGFYDLVVREKLPISLSVDSSLGGSQASGILSNGESEYFVFEIPETVGGAPVPGWLLTAETVQGTAKIRVREGGVPQGNPSHNSTTATTFSDNSKLTVPPYLKAGTWYLEIVGDGATQYTLTSEIVRPERVWTMPASSQTTVQAPGLSFPVFGDTEINEAGIDPDPGEEGVPLGNGLVHFYAIDVPEGNAGLLRTFLKTLSGDPNLYIRQDGVPTRHHEEDGTGGDLFDRRLTGNTNSEYGNWVPIDGRAEKQLTPGRWYLMVEATGSSNAVYRLQVSVGDVQELALNGGSLSNQVLVEGDMRFYRVELPLEAPADWNFTFAETQGDVTVFVRDTVPPGNSFDNPSSYGWYDFRHSRSDQKNSDFSAFQERFTSAGTYSLSVPPLRPDHFYYLGVYAESDATFSISSSVSTETIGTIPAVDYSNGLIDISLIPGESRYFRVAVPEDAARLVIGGTHSSSVRTYVENGSLPTESRNHRGFGSGGMSQSMGSWPWVGGEDFYLLVTNTGSVAENVQLQMSGEVTLPAEIAVSGNGQNISDGDTTPSVADGTDFGSVLYTAGSVSRTFRISNSGSGSLAVSASDNSGHFSVSGLAGSIASGSSDEFTVTFDPSTEGTKTATISFMTDDADENPFTFAVAGVGTAPVLPAEIAVDFGGTDIAAGDNSPSAGEGTDFGSVDVGASPIVRTFRVRNTGDESLALGSPSSSAGDFTVAGLVSSIPGGSFDEFTVTFDPSTEGTKTATISFMTDDADENPFTFAVAGVGTAPVLPAEIAVDFGGTDIAAGDNSPSAGEGTDFGSVDVGASPIVRTFRVRNTGDESLALGSPSSSAGDFTVAGLVSSIPGGSFDEFAVTFAPTSAGAKTATISFMTNDADEAPFTFDVTGLGTAPNPPSYPITIDTVLVADAGNPNDSTGHGGVSYGFHIGTYEVTNAQYAAFLNAVAATDTHGLYNPYMSSKTHGGINRTGTSGSFTYSVKIGMGDKPVNFVSFWDAARFTNWLTSGDTENGVYVLTPTGISNNTIIRDATAWNKGGVAIASENEWYKAAYYQPVADGGDADGYWLYPTASNSITTADANYGGSVGTVTNVGTYVGDPSYYGTFDQGGNLREWTDSFVGTQGRRDRGGYFNSLVNPLWSSAGGNSDPTDEHIELGFRVTSLAPIARSVLSAEIALDFGGTDIASGDNSPSGAEGTDFGSMEVGASPIVRTFRVRNTGDEPLALGSPSSNAGDFTVAGLDSSIPGGSSDDFTVTFDPATAGTKTATISFTTNDADEDPFTFAVSGVGKESDSPGSQAGSAIIEPSDVEVGDLFGRSVSLSGETGLVGAMGDRHNGGNSGSAYVFRSLGTASGTVNQQVKLIPSDGAAGDLFGWSVSLSEKTALIGAMYGSSSGSAYVFRDLDTASGAVNQQVKLMASDGAADDLSGFSVSLSGTTGLVGAVSDDGNVSDSGSAFVFRNLNTVGGTVTEQVKLTVSDGASGDNFGHSVSLSGTTGLVGARRDDDNGINSGSAYIFRNLDTVSGTVTQDVKLLASDGAADDEFGHSVSLSDTMGLVGAYQDGDNGARSGSAYLFRNLDTVSGTVTEQVKLAASDGVADDWFGHSVSLSGATGLVGAHGDNDNGSDSGGSAYVFLDLDTAGGTVTEQVRLTASAGRSSDHFGFSVSLDGDEFLIGAYNAGTGGQAYSGSLGSMTSLDEGNASRVISGLSFFSRTDWIVGEATDANEVTLSAGDSADVTEHGTAVYIGKDAGSNDNRLIIGGDLTATTVVIGSPDGNAGNALEILNGASLSVGTIRIAPDNELVLEGDFSSFSALDSFFGAGVLEGWNGASWEGITDANHSDYLSISFDSRTGLTTVTGVGTVTTPPLDPITIETVIVGDAGNPDDATGYGGVSYSYHIGTYEVTNAQYAAFLNAVAATDTHGLYNTNMGSSTHGGINRSGTSGSYSYSVKTGFGDKPVNFVSFWDAARFANWLTNGDTESGVYVLTPTGITSNTITRNNAAWNAGGVAIASENEWYKAAFYQSFADGGDTDGYWLYPTASNSITTADANYANSVGNVTAAGSYSEDASHYGTFDQGGNVWEWNDEIIGSFRGLRGGTFSNTAPFLQSSERNQTTPAVENSTVGFRVSSLAPIGAQGPVSINPIRADFLSSSGATAVSVSSSGAWQVSTSAEWITASPESGSGSGTVTITVEANTGADPRSGSTSIGGATFAISQFGNTNPVSYQNWLLSNGHTPGEGEPTGRQGLNGLLRYSLGLDETDNRSVLDLVKIGREEAADPEQPDRITVDFWTDDSATGVATKVRFSNNLADWHGAETVVQIGSENGMTRWRATSPEALGENIFFVLRAEVEE